MEGKYIMTTWNENNKELIADRSRWRHAKEKYGDAMKELCGLDGKAGYDFLLEQQDHRCKLCGVHLDDVSHEFVHEHCHKTGRIRGLTCRPCNTSIGGYERCIELGENTIQNYLKEEII